MRMTLKQLKLLDVETKSGEKLGHVCDVVFETGGQLVAQYFVRPSLFSGKEYLINRDQVVRFEENKMIVDNSAMQDSDVGVQDREVAAGPEPVVMRKAKFAK